MEGFKGNKTYPKYNTFYVADASTNYTLHLSGYSGKAGKLVLLVLRILQQLLMSSYNYQEIIDPYEIPMLELIQSTTKPNGICYCENIK